MNKPLVCPACGRTFATMRGATGLAYHIGYEHFVTEHIYCWCGFRAWDEPRPLGETTSDVVARHLESVGDLEQHYLVSLMRRADA